jgi:hypothetical protein
MPSTRGFGFKNRNLGGFSPGQEVPKTNFQPRRLRRPHNLRITRWNMNTQKEPFFNCHHPVIFRLVLVLVLCAFFSLACSSPRSTYLTEQRFPPKPPSAPIEIFSEVPDKPYILIGEVSDRELGTWGPADPKLAIEKIKEMARNMGGDAIINYRGYTAPAGTVAAGAFTAQGMAVRWK